LKFCPKCGGVMVPQKKPDGTIVLKCMRCGYEMPADEKALKSYKGEAKAAEKVITTKVVSKAKTTKVSKEELEQAREDYYELVLDQIGEYGE
jgi:DNA-directed RNA polymerase subunit M